MIRSAITATLCLDFLQLSLVFPSLAQVLTSFEKVGEEGKWEGREVGR